MPNFYDLIEAQLRDEINSFVKGRKPSRDIRSDPFQNVIVLSGNGLTRLSGYALKAGDDQSWRNSVRTAWRTVEAKGSFEALCRQGKSLPEIFNVALRQCSDTKLEKKAYGSLWEAVKKTEIKQLKSSPSTPCLQYKILQHSGAVLTTNYDRMFEAACVCRGDSSARYWVPKELEYDDSSRPRSFWQETSPSNSKVIYKIHGTFLEPATLDNPADLERAIDGFETWWGLKGYECTVACSDKYDTLAYKLSSTKFEDQFRPVLDLLNNPDILIACIGLGLGGEEHVITRLLSSRKSAPAPILKFDVASRLDLDPGESRGIYPINVDRGLASSQERRYIATAAFLSVLFEFVKGKDEAVKEFRSIGCDGTRPHGKTIWPRATAISSSHPSAFAIGQASVNRVIGIKEPPTQEQAFGAYPRATLTPGDRKKNEGELHTPLEVGGQSVVPCIVWDALGMPCLIVAGVGDDALGDFALAELSSRTEFLDFDQLHQLVSDNPKRPTRTDHLTAVTWAGLRSIFENHRKILDVSYRGKKQPFDVSRILAARSHAQLVYLTKVGWVDWKRWTQAQLKDKFIVFDTGGGACPEQTARIATLGGIVVASALSAVGEILCDDFRRWTSETETFWTTKIARIKYQAKRPILKPTREAGRVGAQVKVWREGMLPADETGRAHQNLWFLQALKRELVPRFLSERLNDSPAYAVTLGEHGIVYWLRGSRGWSSPTRVWFKIDLGEMRSGLECGDCTRAGVAAALVARQRGSDLKDEDYRAAFSFGAWCGTTKVRFFSLWDYHDALREQAVPTLLDQVNSDVQKEFGKDNLKLHVRSEVLTKNGAQKLIRDLVRETKDPNRSTNWAKARGMS